MVKTDLVNFICREIGSKRKIASHSVEEIINTMKETLVAGEHVQIVGFGRFNIKNKKERMGRDPSSGAEIIISARNVLTFKPSRNLKEAVRKYGGYPG